MNKIEQGIEINNQHIYNVINQIPEEISFYKQIIDLGFEDLEDFFNQKKEYEMQQCLRNKVIDVLPKDAMATFASFLKTKTYAIASIVTDQTCVHCGNDPNKTINVQYCKDNNIPIYPYDTFGGSIVVSKGDYTIILSVPEKINISSTFLLRNFEKILKKYFTNISIEGNDILYNNKKIAGSTNLSTEDSFSLSITFSMSPKDELIYNICGEPTTGKYPGYLDQNVLSTDKLKEELLTWLQGL